MLLRADVIHSKARAVVRRCGTRVLEGILSSRIYQAYRRGQEKIRS